MGDVICAGVEVSVPRTGQVYVSKSTSMRRVHVGKSVGCTSSRRGTANARVCVGYTSVQSVECTSVCFSSLCECAEWTNEWKPTENRQPTDSSDRCPCFFCIPFQTKKKNVKTVSRVWVHSTSKHFPRTQNPLPAKRTVLRLRRLVAEFKDRRGFYNFLALTSKRTVQLDTAEWA